MNVKWLVVLLLIPLCYGATLGDRLLLEINNYSYTQRQLEAHMLVKKNIEARYQTGELFNQNNWRDLLNTFQQDMLILLEIERYGWYDPSLADIETAQHNILRNLGNNPTDFVRLGIDSSMLTNLIISNLKISLYRNRQTTLNEGNSWLEKLAKKNYLRLYHQSSIYQPIFPQRGTVSN